MAAGVNWLSRTSAADNAWRSVVYGNGIFVAVANSGTTRVMTSPDGKTWTLRTPSADNNWRGVTYGNGLFVAVADSGTDRVMTSPDGITWTARSASAANSWQAVTYGGGLFVATANNGSGSTVMTSPDGITWTGRTPAANNQWLGVTWGNGLFVAVAISGTNRVMTSPDGITWTARSASAANNWTSVTYGLGLFVSVSATGTGDRVMTSPDGITWTGRTSANDFQWQSVIFGHNLFVAVSATGSGNRAMTSPDGITWTARTTPDSTWRSVTFKNNLFVAVSSTGTGDRAMESAGMPLAHDTFTGADTTVLSSHTSDSGHSWVAIPSTSSNTLQISGNKIVHAGGNSKIGYYSSVVPVTADYDVECICKLNGDFNTGGPAGRIQTSDGGRYWAEYEDLVSGWQLYSGQGSTANILGNYVGDKPDVERRCTLRFIGSTIKVLIDGVERISVTDTAYTTAGRPGITDQTFFLGQMTLDAWAFIGTDEIPDAFTFTDQTNVPLSTIVESNTITVTGTDAVSFVTITGGEYSKNAGAYTSANGSAIVGDTFKVRHTSSGSNSATTNTTLTIEGESDTFSSTTLSAGGGFLQSKQFRNGRRR